MPPLRGWVALEYAFYTDVTPTGFRTTEHSIQFYADVAPIGLGFFW